MTMRACYVPRSKAETDFYYWRRDYRWVEIQNQIFEVFCRNNAKFFGRLIPDLDRTSQSPTLPLASKGPRTPDRSGDFDRREWSNVLETEYPNKIHRQWNPLAGQKLKSLIEAAGIAERIDESRDNPAAQLACPDVKGHPALQAHCKRLYADWNGILNAVAEAFDKAPETYRKEHRFNKTKFRKDGLPVGACSRCGSELFFESEGKLQCRDCGKYSALSRKGPAPFSAERQKLRAILNSDDDLENISAKAEDFLTQPVAITQSTETGWSTSISIGDLLFNKGGWGEFSTNRQRPSTRKALVRATWLANRQSLGSALSKRFPLIRDLDGNFRISTRGMTEYGRAQYREQTNSAGTVLACAYWWAFCGMADQEIACALTAPLTTQQVKDRRESFLAAGENLCGARTLRAPYKHKWAAFTKVLVACRPYQIPELLAPALKTVARHDVRFVDLGTRFGKHAHVEFGAPYSLEHLKLGLCRCERWGSLIFLPSMEWSDSGQKHWRFAWKCSACTLADLETRAWIEHPPAKLAEPIENISPVLSAA
jgi:hypothetical protein